MRPLLIALMTAALLSGPTALADALPDVFASATREYQQGNYDSSFEQFQSAYMSQPEHPALLFNYGLAAYKLQKRGLALGLWRRALFLDPELQSASDALNVLSDEMSREVIYPTAVGFEKFNQSVLQKFSLDKILATTLMLFALSGFLSIRYWALRKRALEKVLPLPPPPIAAGILLAGLALSLLLSVAKGLAMQELRATVTATAATMRTGPSEEDNAVFDLIEGLEVIVRHVDGTWAQVKLPGGASGWVPTRDIFQHTGKIRAW